MAGDRLLHITANVTHPCCANGHTLYGSSCCQWCCVKAPLPASILNATVTVSLNSTVRILAFHHHQLYNASQIGAKTVAVSVCGLDAYADHDVPGQMWRLGEGAPGEWWSAWWSDLLDAGIDPYDSHDGVTDSWHESGGGP
jgi:hypothetical protein